MDPRDSAIPRAIADLTRAGWSAEQIAILIGLSARTVKRHRQRLQEVKAEVREFMAEFTRD